jgi:hypothetical protein
MKRLGPDLKIPDFKSAKVPSGLQDFYLDLKDRRLLPVIALILAAIVATPFLLGGGPAEEGPPAASVPLEGAPLPPASSLTVVKAEPGLRDYRKRLRHRKAHNPFRPHFTGPVLAGTQLGGGGTSTTSTTATTSTTDSSSSVTVESPPAPSPSPSGGSSGGAPAGNGGGKGNEESGGPTTGGQLTYFAFAIDVKITKTVSKANGDKPEPENIEKKHVLPPAALPGEKTQVVTYLGISPTTKKPLLLVSEDVGSVFGEVECLAGTGRCQLIEVEPQMPVTFVYGENDVRYKIDILKVEPVSTSHP